MHIIEVASGPAYTLYGRIENDVCQIKAYIASLPEKDQKQVFVRSTHEHETMVSRKISNLRG